MSDPTSAQDTPIAILEAVAEPAPPVRDDAVMVDGHNKGGEDESDSEGEEGAGERGNGGVGVGAGAGAGTAAVSLAWVTLSWKHRLNSPVPSFLTSFSAQRTSPSHHTHQPKKKKKKPKKKKKAAPAGLKQTDPPTIGLTKIYVVSLDAIRP